MSHLLSCRCGALKGVLSQPDAVNRCVCYCKDCQAFAYFLEQAEAVLDSTGGTEVIQTTPANVTFTQGQSKLACVRLHGKGLLRWYTSCCRTPIGNTLPNFHFAFVGLVHSCLDGGGESLESSFGPIRMWVNTQSARTPVVARPMSAFTGIMRVMGMLIRDRLTGRYQSTPFFSPVTGVPVVKPIVLSESERARVYAAVNGSATLSQ